MNKNTTKPPSIIETRPHLNKIEMNNGGIQPTPLAPSSSKKEPITSSTFENIKEISFLNTPELTLSSPEYALLSRQPEEFAEETFRLINLKTRTDGERQRNYQSKRDNNLGHSVYAKKDEDSTKNSITAVIGTRASSKTLQSLTNTEKRIKPRHSSSIRLVKNVSATVHPSKLPIESTSQSNTKTHRKNNRETTEKRKGSRHKSKR